MRPIVQDENTPVVLSSSTGGSTQTCSKAGGCATVAASTSTTGHYTSYVTPTSRRSQRRVCIPRSCRSSLDTPARRTPWTSTPTSTCGRNARPQKPSGTSPTAPPKQRPRLSGQQMSKRYPQVMRSTPSPEANFTLVCSLRGTHGKAPKTASGERRARFVPDRSPLKISL